jgi:hypothetical protein
MPGTIVATKELARTFENEVGSAGGKAVRRWVCMLSDDTLTSGGPPGITDILTATTGGTWGAAHPVHTRLGLRKIAVNERFEDNPYALEVVGEYGLVLADEVLAPTFRAAIWSFESRAGQVPAFYHYIGSGNGTLRALTNSAYDYYPGLVTDEAVVRIQVQKNFSTVPYSWLSLQNYVNNATYLGCAPQTIKVDAIEVQPRTEEWNNSLQTFYTAVATLTYRQSSHNLLIPDIGFNYIDGTEKRRAMVFDFQNAEWVASPNPVGLDGFGGQTLGFPAINAFRCNPQANLQATFGTP